MRALFPDLASYPTRGRVLSFTSFRPHEGGVIAAATPLVVPLAPEVAVSGYDAGTYASTEVVPLLEPPRCVTDYRVTGRSSRAVLEDLFFTFTGCSSISAFFGLQAAGAELRRRVRAGATFSHPDVRPRIPAMLLVWYHDTAARVLATTTVDERPASRSSGRRSVPSVLTSASAGSVTSSVGDSFVRYLLPEYEELPPTSRTDRDALLRIRRLVLEYLTRLRTLITTVLSLEERWGLLYQEELCVLNDIVNSEKRARVSMKDILHAFSSLNLTDEGVREVTEEVRRCVNVRSFILDNNPLLTRLNNLPPSCHTVMAGGCGLTAIDLDTCACHVLILGLSNNQLDNLDFLDRFPALRVLDVSSNRLVSLQAVMDSLQRHPSITGVVLAGNPAALLDAYRYRLAAACPLLESIDHRLIHAQERYPLDVARMLAAPEPTPPHKSPRGPARPTRARKKENPEVVGMEEAADFLKKLHFTVEVGIEVLLLQGLSSLVHNPCTLTSTEDLDPEGVFFQRLIGADHSLFTSSEHSSSRVQAASSRHRLPKIASATMRPVSLYECDSVLVVRGTWGGLRQEDDTDSNNYIPIHLDAIPLSVPQQSPEKGKAAAAARLRRALAVSATTAMKDICYPKSGTFCKDMELSPTLAERLRLPIVLHIEVHDTIRIPSYVHLRGLLEGTIQTNIAGRRPHSHVTTPSPVKLEKGLLSDPASETHIYELGTITLCPESLLRQDHSATVIADGRLRPRREMFAQHCLLQRSTTDKTLEEEAVRSAREALREAVVEWSQTNARLAEEKTRLISELEVSAVAMQVTPTTTALRKAIAKNVSPKVSQAQLQLQAELEKHNQTILELGARFMSRQSRIAQLWDTGEVFLDARLWIGRGATPPAVATLAAEYAKKVQAAVFPQHKKGRRRSLSKK